MNATERVFAGTLRFTTDNFLLATAVMIRIAFRAWPAPSELRTQDILDSSRSQARWFERSLRLALNLRC
jgi:hypothetical protein